MPSRHREGKPWWGSPAFAHRLPRRIREKAGPATSSAETCQDLLPDPKFSIRLLLKFVELINRLWKEIVRINFGRITRAPCWIGYTSE